jgi:hypothetical protein
MLNETRLELLDASNLAVTVGTPVVHVGIGGQVIGITLRHVGTRASHTYSGALAQVEVGAGWSMPISITSVPGQVQILGYTLPIGRVFSGLRGDSDPPPDALGGRIVAITAKGSAGYGHELTALFFLGSPFESVGDFVLDVVAGATAIVPVAGIAGTLIGQARYVTVFAGGLVENSLSASIGVGGGLIG